jgi:two-component system, OmpR family, phosphate regulon response regulator PhoB
VRILIVDDDAAMRELLSQLLGEHGYDVCSAAELDEARRAIAVHAPDLILLDVVLGDQDGRELLHQVPALAAIPLIVLSGRGLESDRVAALKMGADDYVVKPFSPDELVARIESVIRRSKRGGNELTVRNDLTFSGLRIDRSTREVEIRGELVDLTAKEFDLLSFLASSPKRVFSRRQLLEHVWSSSDDWQDESTVTEHIRRVRKKIELDPDRPSWVTTVRGVGYRFEPPGRQGRATSPVARPRTLELSNHGDSGFTLVELLIVVVILPIVIGSLALAVTAVISLQGGVTNRVSDAADAQVVSTNFENDVHSAQQVTTASTSSPQCGTNGTQVLGLEWGQTVVSYVQLQQGTTYSLLREVCTSGSSTPVSGSTVSFDISNGTPPSVSITPASKATAAASGWTSTTPSAGPPTTPGITGVNLSVSEPKSSYSYALEAVPSAGASTGTLSSVSSTSGCNFATPGTGTYAQRLCFIDFSSLNSTQAASTTPSGGCSEGQPMSFPVSGTPDSISFCLYIPEVSWGANNTSSCLPNAVGPICPATIPTYYAPPTSEAFLGNNGFYTGIAGRPALYEITSGEAVTLYFTQIKVTDPSGNLATNWDLVTGDAESTDAGESLTFSTCPSITATGAYPAFGATCSSTATFALVPNSSSSAFGNACAYPPAGPVGSYSASTWLTGVGTNTVECAASVNSDKTGTLMVSTLAPNTLTVHMVGAGLQAMFLGVLLP